MSGQLHDVVVIGAGPAGSAAAIELARGGADVVMIDRATFPRDKCCGDGLTALALRKLEALGVEPSHVASWNDVNDVHLRSPSGRHVSLPLPRDSGRFAAVTRRTDLDHALVEQAAAAGAEVMQGTRMTTISPSPDTIAVSTDHATFEAKYVIAADGMWSPTRKALGLSVDGYRGEWHAFRQYRIADGESARNLWVWFEEDLLPGYAWSFPLPDSRVNVGFGIVRGERMSGAALAAIWDDLLNRPHIADVLGNNEAEAPHKAWPIPARIHDIALVGPRTMFVGDAAAATDPMTGEGIGQALETGILAAEAVLAAEPTAAATLERYQNAARQSLVADHHMAASLSKVLARRWATDASIRIVDTNDWTRRNFARWMFEDYPRAALVTPRRWRRGLFSADGAYAG